MIHISRVTAALALLLPVLGVHDVQAQQMPTVLVNIAPCMALATNTERYACYDQLEAAVHAAQNSPAISAVSPTPAGNEPAAASRSGTAPDTGEPDILDVPTPATVPTATTVENFGVAPDTGGARVATGADGAEELHDRITDLREREPGRWLVMLESGQVWYQTNSQRMRLRKGMEVRIYPSPLGGSFRMARVGGADTGFIQVDRIE
jgi:hypothetical protein